MEEIQREYHICQFTDMKYVEKHMRRPFAIQRVILKNIK